MTPKRRKLLGTFTTVAVTGLLLWKFCVAGYWAHWRIESAVRGELRVGAEKVTVEAFLKKHFDDFSYHTETSEYRAIRRHVDWGLVTTSIRVVVTMDSDGRVKGWQVRKVYTGL